MFKLKILYQEDKEKDFNVEDFLFEDEKEAKRVSFSLLKFGCVTTVCYERTEEDDELDNILSGFIPPPVR